MTYSRILAAAAVAVCAGCNSLDSPFAGTRLSSGGRDARAFNPQTGEYEWPKDSAAFPGTARETSSAAPAAAGAPKPDGRPYDPQKGEFLNPDPTR